MSKGVKLVYDIKEALYRIENIEKRMFKFTETPFGNYLGKYNIIRYEDVYVKI